ncbi:thioredoxin domain-containing protein [Plakobranchus ocellatus]|uniref:Thioredoxin domain-containing protein n=1 Tax=Plakobranchus ocellatus TaxID=259542 RepID=A0AAV3YC88_9GAST|nr:thioredoxin domain-containing protein [Plakobranchus ocellatus]
MQHQTKQGVLATGWHLCFIILMILMSQTCWGAEEEAKILDVNVDGWQEAYNGARKLLVLLYKTEGCQLCPDALQEFTTILGQPEIPTGVKLGKSADAALMKHLNIDNVPALVFLRDKSFIIYDGQIEVESMLHWVPLAADMTVQTLDDSSFEHLTQASTGATTGDWLVAFYQLNCQDVISMLDAVGVRFKGRVIVAKVDMTENRELVDRFKVKECPHIIYFRQGKMYRYDLPKLDAASLRSFLDGFYKNSKAENVPIPKSKFDYLTEGMADFLKTQMEGENRNVVLAAVCGLAVSFLFIIFLCCRSILEPPPKTKEE